MPTQPGPTHLEMSCSPKPLNPLPAFSPALSFFNTLKRGGGGRKEARNLAAEIDPDSEPCKSKDKPPPISLSFQIRMHFQPLGTVLIINVKDFFHRLTQSN